MDELKKEDLALLTADTFHTVNGYRFAYCEKGVRMETGNKTGYFPQRSIPATLFPSPITLGCSFDTELIFEVGKAVGAECVSDGADLMFAAEANVNIDGRANAYSEDTLLAGKACGADIKGAQSMGVSAVARNFFLPKEESCVSKRALKEIYAKAFYIAIEEGAPRAVSVCAKLINGEGLCESPLIKDVLRGYLSYDGAVIAEPFAICDRISSLKATVDIEASPDLDMPAALTTALKKGFISLEEVEERIRKAKELFSFDNVIIHADMTANDLLSVKAAEESITLLKNDGALPLKGDSVVIVGEEKTQDGAKVNPYENISLASALDEALSVKVASITDKPILDADVALIWMDEGSEDVALEYKKAGIKTIALMNYPKPFNVAAFDAILYVGLYGQGGSRALSKILLGEVCPSGKLSVTIREKEEDEDMFFGYMKEGDAEFSFGKGLSYTTFTYSSLKLSANVFRQGERIYVSVDVENSGEIAGKEVVQLYVSPVKSRVKRAKRTLRAFVKIRLEAKEKRSVIFTLDDEDLFYYDEYLDRFNIETGLYNIEIGSASDDVRLTRQLQVFSKDNMMGKDVVTSKKVAKGITPLTNISELKKVSRKAYSLAMKKAKAYGKAVDLPISALRAVEKNLVERIIETANK